MAHPLELLERFRQAPKNLIHIGANNGSEHLAYKEANLDNVIYIEAVEEVFIKLKRRLKDHEKHVPIQAVVSDTSGEEVTFNITSNSALSSSMLPLGRTGRLHPELQVEQRKLLTTTLDDLLVNHKLDHVSFDAIVADIQGAEMKALKGALKTLENTYYLYLEASLTPLYDGGCTFYELQDFLSSMKYHVVDLEVNSRGNGDALFIREDRLDLL
ncbi:MAG: FkbM family methyltransferase [Aquisalinus sp.]|nr:FkbM family methyltransferase [Aquisalinus sp.]